MKKSLRLGALALALLSGASVSAQSYTFSTVAGFAKPFGSTDDVGGNARFYFPHFALVAPSGNLYVADTFNHTIRGITPSGIVFTILGQAGQAGIADPVTGIVRFNRPEGMAIDAFGSLYVCESGNHIIRKFTAAGGFFFVGSPGVAGSADGTGATARFNAPYGLAIGGDGSLYVADRGNRTIRKVTSAGVVTTLAGSAGLTGATDGAGSVARFSLPAGIAVDGAGSIYVADGGNATIRKITSAGVVTTVAGLANNTGTTNGVGAAARFTTPIGIAVDASGTLFVSDSSNYLIRRITPDGTVTTFAGGANTVGNANGTGTAARFYAPFGVTLDPAGNLYVVDSNNHSVRKITTAAVVTAFAGSGGTTGSTNGPADAARFNRPYGVVADSKGDLLVADTSNNTIRRISAAGIVTTVAGSPGLNGSANGTGGTARFVVPYSLSIDGADNLYVADTGNHLIRKVTPEGVVTTIAGLPGSIGSADGVGSTARFSNPRATAFDANGNIYVADSLNHLIRKIAPDGTVSTVAGLAGTSGAVDGAGSTARFNLPNGVAVDAAGNVYVADTNNSLIRKITPGGDVTTLAGSAGLVGTTDGTGSAARFRSPFNLAVDATGDVFVTDTGNDSIRKITSAGVVTTIGGSFGATFSGADGTGSAARFFSPIGIFVDARGVLYISDEAANTIVKGVLDRTPEIPVPPQSLNVVAGSSVTLSVGATGGGLSYAWFLNGSAITGATGSSYTIKTAQASAAGAYTVAVSNSAGARASSPATLTLVSTTDVGRLINLSILTTLPVAGEKMTVGTVLGGAGTSGAKPLLVRAGGPTLGVAPFNIPGVLSDPKLDLFSGQTVVASNNDWNGGTALVAAAAQVGAFPFFSPASRDAAVAYTATVNSPPASYTVEVSAVGNATGTVLAEIYDATSSSSFTAATPRLINVSVLKNIGDGLTAGFYVGGATARTVLIRAIGPTLANFGVAGALANPKLELFSGQTVINENDDWKGDSALATAFGNVGAFSLSSSSKDAALVITLPPGPYTARVTGVGGTTGSALVEVYEVP